VIIITPQEALIKHVDSIIHPLIVVTTPKTISTSSTRTRQQYQRYYEDQNQTPISPKYLSKIEKIVLIINLSWTFKKKSA
jgi:hypothetical protein